MKKSGLELLSITYGHGEILFKQTVTRERKVTFKQFQKIQKSVLPQKTVVSHLN